MKANGTRLGLIAVLLSWCGWIAFSGTSTATLEHQKQAKAAGVEAAKNCTYCHVDKLPKKDEGKHELNDVGKWLVAEKEKRGAKTRRRSLGQGLPRQEVVSRRDGCVEIRGAASVLGLVARGRRR